MTTVQAAYRVCKYIRSLPIRREIAERVIPALRPRDLGYYGRKENVQFLGYLIVNKRREEFQSMPHPITIKPLSTEELQLLEHAHACILEVDKTCCGNITQVLPNATQAVDPYVGYDYRINDDLGSRIHLNAEKLKDLSTAFNEHPSLRIIAKYVKKAEHIHRIPSKELVALVHLLSDRIDTSGLFNVPSDVDELKVRLKRDSQDYYVAKILSALVAWRVSVSVLNQLLYEAFVSENLGVLDQNNVIQIEKQVGNFLGESISILAQPNGKELFFSAPGDVILVKLRLDDRKIDGLYRIENMNLSFDRDFGHTQKFGLRWIDNNLNCYPGLADER